MKSQALVLMAFVTLFGALDATAQSRSARAAGLIATGRANMAKQTAAGIAAAHKNFSDALKAAPNSPEANLLYAATLLLSEHESRGVHNELQSIGIGVIDSNPYAFELSYAVDRYGRFAPFRYSGTNKTLAFIRSKSALRSRVLGCLRKITDRNFRMVISSAETSLLDVTVDYADVLFLRVVVLCYSAFLDMTTAHNLDAEYLAIYKLAINPDVSPELALKSFPSAFNLTSQASKRLSARLQLQQANKELQDAYAFIENSRIRGGGTPNLFQVDEETNWEEDSRTLDALAKSLFGVQTLPVIGEKDEGSLEGRKIDLSRLFVSKASPRSFFPDSFDRGYVRPGSWKDPTFGGVLPDFTKSEVDNALFAILQNTTPEPYTFSTFAGWPGTPGYETPGGEALFGYINGVAVDAGGNVYVADNLNHVIQKITPQGEVSDYVGKRWTNWSEREQLWNDYVVQDPGQTTPSGIFYGFSGGLDFDSDGSLFFTADGLLYKFHENDGLVVFAGQGNLSSPTRIAIDANDNVFVCDSGVVRKVTPQGAVSNLAGQLWDWGYVEGTGAGALFTELGGIAVDTAGNVFVADTYNYVIRRITPGGVTSTYAGSRKYDRQFDAVGTQSRFKQPTSISIGPDGSLFVLDDELVRKINPQTKVTTIGGKSWRPGRSDGTGEEARFGNPYNTAIAAGPGKVYVTDDTTVRVGVK